jgi:4-phytase/acid phosphatase
MFRSRSLVLVPLCLGAFAAESALAQPTTPAPPRDTLVQVVLVSRHGVRTPLIATNVLDAWTGQPWPTWAEPLGYLTAHGRDLTVLLGRYHRASLAAQGVLPSSGCPDPASVYFYADVDQRTLETARGLLDGLAPGCGIPVHSKSPANLDPVFHPVEGGGSCLVDTLTAQTGILERVRGSVSSVVAQHHDALLTIQSALKCCQPFFCAAFGRPAECTLPDIPTALSNPSGAPWVGLLGGLQVASDVAELFLLEYANGMKSADVGWGRIDGPGIQRALDLHDADFDLLYRTPYLAHRHASALLARVAEALTGQALDGLAPQPEVRNARLIAYIGHDTNVASLGGLLDATWAIPGSPLSPTLPAGALMFERRRSPDGRERVYLSYVVQTLEQMRSASPLTLDAPPVKTAIRIPGCSSSEPGYPCAVDDFSRLARSLIVPTCVAGR